MDPERPHRSTSINNSSSNTTSTTTSELFICFTSRLSSSSMKISSKSILSPARSAREPSQISLSASLTRRLRSNSSMKGGQASPMFPANGKKRGCAFENPEPSSPKVTCIGQVRVKTKKQGKKFRACRSKRRGEVSFRKVDHKNVNNGSNSLDTSSCQDYNMGHFLSNNSHHHHHHHQQQQQQQECKKWVHLPLTICEALRAFRAEFNCFLPCRSSCMANQRNKEEKTRGSAGSSNGNGNGSSSCGAVFARWLVAVQEEEGKQREIEFVVGGDDDDDERRESSEMMRSSQRRHVFEDIEINDCSNKNLGDGEEARVSICIPPKNALLLMRCRSDPVKMAALANKFWETPLPKDKEEEEEEEEEEEAQDEDQEEEAENGSEEKEEEQEVVQEDDVEVEREEKQVEIFEQEMEHQEVSEVSEMFVSCEATDEQEIPEAEVESEAQTEAEAEPVLVRIETEVVEESLGRSLKEEETINIIDCQDQEQEQETEVEEEQQVSTIEEETLPEVSFDLERLQIEENVPEIEQENNDGLEEELQQEEAAAEAEDEEEDQAVFAQAEEDEGSTSITEKTHEKDETECPEMGGPDPADESKESGSQQNLLPDCLLLMMCEPKLSMEVSKETWVCSTDFIRWAPEKKKKQPPAVKQKDGEDEPKRRIRFDPNPAPILLQPHRSSCSFPVAPPMATGVAASAAANDGAGGDGSIATMIEQKLVGGKGKGYEPFVLTRCKSEPRRSSSAKLAPDACFWKNGKLEPTTLGVGAAGVGF